MESRTLGQIIVMCAPSGTGKSTLVRKLKAEFPRIRYSVSFTTRSPREGEVDGKDYYFTSIEEFEKLITEDFFAEWAQVHGNYYGTPKPQTMEMLNQGYDILFDIDVQGARQIRDNLKQGCYIFLLPPSREELEARLRGRQTDSEEVIARRIKNAKEELQQADLFDFWIVNDNLETAYEDLKSVYRAHKLTPARDRNLVQRLLKQWSE